MCKSPALRPATPHDDELLFRLYATTRSNEFQQTGWNEAQRTMFLRQQFEARRRSYRADFPNAVTFVIMHDRTAIGGAIIQRTDCEIRLIDIALMPAHRGAGIGCQLLNHLQVEARSTGRPLRLSVLKSSRARRLYERLGFNPIGITADYVRMEWTPPTDGNSLSKSDP